MSTIVGSEGREVRHEGGARNVYAVGEAHSIRTWHLPYLREV